jgi:hypothetical protein
MRITTRSLLHRTLCASFLLLPLSAHTAFADKPTDGDWIELIGPGGFDAWQRVDERLAIGGGAELVPDNDKNLRATPGEGVLVAERKQGYRFLVTKREFGDCKLHAEFLIANQSNSGIKLHGHYEIQIYDSHGKPDEKLHGSDCGGVYPRWYFSKGKFTYLDEGVPPSTNATKPPGEWQTLDVVFRAPRFDDDGNKTENARLDSVKLNGQVIHNNVELKTPTGLVKKNAKEFPRRHLSIQLNHGPVAYRNVRIRELP